MPSLPAKMKILLLLAKTLEKQKLNFSRSALFHMETGVSLKYFVSGCSKNLTKLLKVKNCKQQIQPIKTEKCNTYRSMESSNQM